MEEKTNQERQHFEIELDGRYHHWSFIFPESIDAEDIGQVVGYITAWFTAKGHVVENVRRTCC